MLLKLLPLSDVTITLNASNDYLKTLTLLYGFALYVFLPLDVSRSLYVLVISGLFFCWSYSFFYKKKIGFPFTRVRIHHDTIEVTDNQHQVHQYDKIHASIHAGFFSMYQLSNEKKRRLWIIFYDQLTLKERKLLRLVSQKN